MSLRIWAAMAIALALSACGGTVNPVGSGAAVQTTATASGTSAAPSDPLSFSAASYPVAQNAGTVSLSVKRTGTATGAVSVDFATADGTAIAGTDYTATTGTVKWADNDSTPQTIVVPISNATPYVSNKTFQVALSNASTGAVLASPDSATVTISGDGTATVGSLQISASSYTVAQGAGTVTVTVNRTGGSNGAVSAAYATSNGTAMAGTDFTAASGTMHWASGDVTPKTFVVTISNATPFSGSKSFTVALSSPTAGVTLGTPSSADVTITGDASPPVGSVELSASSYTVAQSGGAVTVTVNRTGGSSGAVGAAYATSNGTAAAGTDFTAARGTVQWANGDATSKTISIAVSAATSFPGTKSFTLVLSNPSGGAALNSPESASVTITGSGSTTGSMPSAPTGLLMTGQTASSISLSWSAAAPGSSPISHYKIYRNGSSYATSTATSYTDTNATNANSPVPGNSGPTLVTANTVYAYAVSAVDTAGNEGPQQANATFWVYYNGVFNWLGDFSYPVGNININYADTSGAPESGPADIEVSYIVAGPGFQPYAGKTTTVWDMEGGSFGYISLDLKPTISGDSWRIFIISRLPPGDVYPWSAVQLSNYGPAPVAGKWATYKIPLSVLTIGYTHFSGSISGTTLTVTSVSSGVGVDAGGYVTGPGVPAGTYITATNGANGGAGRYTIAGPGITGSTSVASTAMVEQRTGIYKFNLVDESSAPINHYYMDNVKFTVN